MITDPLLVEEDWTPPSSCKELDQPLRARAGAEISSLRSPEEKPAPTGRARRPVRAGTARSGRLEVAAALQRVCPPARRCSAAQVAALIRVFLAAGWTTGDLVYALDPVRAVVQGIDQVPGGAAGGSGDHDQGG